MKVIIAGGRDFTNTQALIDFLIELQELNQLPVEFEIVEGGARGADRCGHDIAKATGWRHTQFPADWDRLGKRAGYVRNAEMAEYADVLVACWDSKSRGTKHMIETMQKKGKPVHVYSY